MTAIIDQQRDRELYLRPTTEDAPTGLNHYFSQRRPLPAFIIDSWRLQGYEFYEEPPALRPHTHSS